MGIYMGIYRYGYKNTAIYHAAHLWEFGLTIFPSLHLIDIQHLNNPSQENDIVCKYQDTSQKNNIVCKYQEKNRSKVMNNNKK